MSFNHAMVYVRDVKRALRFYAGRLGLRLIEEFPGYARLRSPAGMTTIALHQFERGQSSKGRGVIRLYFETRKLEQLCRKLKASGTRIKQMPRVMPWGWTHAYLADPDGNEISLYLAGRKRLQRSKL